MFQAEGHNPDTGVRWEVYGQIEGERFEEGRSDDLWDKNQSSVGDGTDMLHLSAVEGHWQRCVHTYGFN